MGRLNVVQFRNFSSTVKLSVKNVIVVISVRFVITFFHFFGLFGTLRFAV